MLDDIDMQHRTGSSLVQVMACHLLCVKPLPEPIMFNTLRPRQNGCHFADDSLKCIFLNENVCISIDISLKFVSKHPINISALVQIMAWHRPGDKPLSEPMMVRLPMHICVTQPQWVNHLLHHQEQTSDKFSSKYNCFFQEQPLKTSSAEW